MKSIPSLTGSHLRTYKTVFRHPISHNLQWHDVHALFRHLGEVVEEANGNLKVTVKGKVLILRPANSKDVSSADELMALRHFLELTETVANEDHDGAMNWLVVIDHHEARIFRSAMPGTVSEQILPPEPEEYFRHVHNSKDFAIGKEKPDPNTYFEPVAQALGSADSILIFGSGTGASNEMNQFLAWLKIHHPELAGRVVGTQVVDESHLTNGQLLAKAREFHEKALNLK